LRVDAQLVNVALDDVPATARRIEDLGFDGAYTFEGPHDPFLPLALAAEHTSRIRLMTAVAVAFARSPMHLAHLAWDLQGLSGGRFTLGLGSQVRAHVERRYSMAWSKPAERMRELALAIRAIWTAWQNGTLLRFEGEHYRHTLMTPMFTPAPLADGPPRLFLAGVGPRMTEVAGEVADGYFVHPFGSAQSLRELTLPALGRGLARAGRDRADVEVAWPLMVATGADDDELTASVEAARLQVAFYGSTPAYRPVLEVHGWGDLQDELASAIRGGRWEALPSLVPDEVLDAVVVRGPLDEIATLVRERTDGLVDRVAGNGPTRPGPEQWRALLALHRG
jgi:probable F420-dependent oxidoreductase